MPDQPFIFRDHWAVEAAIRVRLPAHLNSKAALLKSLAEYLKFPDYFGNNWDALEECIRDRSWLPPGDVILEHADLPLAGDESNLRIYLAVLRDAVEAPRLSTNGALVVTFPANRGDSAGIARRAERDE